MCGLVGIAGDLGYDWRDVFTDLLIVDSVRGMHSTGMAAVKRYKQEIELLKRPGPSHFLISQKEYKEAMAEPMKVLLGHNRYATIGEHTIANAHPFEFQNVVGAHNGTLEKRSINKLHDSDKYGTDSEALYSHMDMYGIEDTVEKLHGAWALTWFNVNENTINFLRNDKRPLYYTYSKDHSTLLWASELDMLKFAMGRHGKLEKDHVFFTVDVDQHLSWTIPNFPAGKFDLPTKVERKGPPTPTVTYTYYGSGGGWKEKDNRQHGYGYNDYSSKKGGGSANVVPFTGGTQKDSKTSGTTSTGDLFKNKRNTEKFRPPYKNAKGQVLNKKLFNMLVANGCVMCQDNSSMWGEFIQPLQDQDGVQIYLCEDCYNDDEIFETCKHLM